MIPSRQERRDQHESWRKSDVGRFAVTLLALCYVSLVAGFILFELERADATHRAKDTLIATGAAR